MVFFTVYIISVILILVTRARGRALACCLKTLPLAFCFKSERHKIY